MCCGKTGQHCTVSRQTLSYCIPQKQPDAPKLAKDEGSWKLWMERLQFQSLTVTASSPRSRPCSRRVSEFFQTHSVYFPDKLPSPLNPVESFQPSTTYFPAAAIEVSDWPSPRSPLVVMSSERLAASTLSEVKPPPERLRLERLTCTFGPFDCGPKHHICAPEEA